MRGWAVALCCAGCALGRHQPASPSWEPKLDITIASTIAPNGLRIVVVDDPRASEVQVTVRYQVGAVDDPPERPGLAHLVEHLTYAHSVGDESLFARLEEVASSFNGATTYDGTEYTARAPRARLEDLLAIEVARLEGACADISPSAFTREREVVINELREREPASSVLAVIHGSLFPPGHPYRQQVGGTPETVHKITQAEACAFAAAHYAPNNAALVVSGHLGPAQLQSIQAGFLAKLPRRSVTTPASVAAELDAPGEISTAAPLDDDALLVVWALPTDPKNRARVRALVAALVPFVDDETSGAVSAIELGDTRATAIGIAVVPAHGDSLATLHAGLARALERLPEALARSGVTMLGGVEFGRIRQRAVYGAFATLEDGGDRDSHLAIIALAGGDPAAEFATTLAAVRDMTSYAAAYLARESLSLTRARVISLHAAGTRRGAQVALAPPLHDLGQRHRAIDPAEARRMLPTDAGATSATTLRLANGLRIVLLPLTSVPTIEMRLVFDAGTADEPADQRGVAQVAAHALTWDARYLPDLSQFAAAGGTHDVEIDPDLTTFSTHGIDRDLPVLLAGLRRWVVDGTYDESIDATLDALRRARRKHDDHDALTAAWRAAVFGDGHPYVAAGLARHGSTHLGTADASRFRAARYTPDAATLVIAGHFDPAIAQHWVEFLFADWTGRAAERSVARATPHPRSIGAVEALSQLDLRIAIPATGANRAAQLVAAEMISAIAADVRHQLGASYGFTAQLAESRLATTFFISGYVAAPQGANALELVRARLAALRSDPQIAARAFVAARDQVVLRLRSLTLAPDRLAARAAEDVALGRPALSELGVANQVAALTIDKMQATLGDLDLARAAIAIRGPAPEVAGAFDALDRRPTYVDAVATADAPDDVSAPGMATVYHRTSIAPVAALVEPEAATSSDLASTALSPNHAITVTPGLAFGRIDPHRNNLPYTGCCTGFSVGGDVGLRLGGTSSIGVHLGLGILGAHVQDPMLGDTSSFLLPIDIGAFVQSGVGPLWASGFASFHLDWLDGFYDAPRELGISVGGELGVDLVRVNLNRFGAFIRGDYVLGNQSGYAAITVGMSVRQ